VARTTQVVDDLSTLRHRPDIRPEVMFQFGSAQESRWQLQLDPRDVGAVFHLAGKVGPSGVLRFRGLIAKDSIDGALGAAWWARQAGVPMVDISTSEVYGSPDEANSEDTWRVFRPGHSARMEYAVAKLAAEQALLNTDDLDVRIIRPFNVTGARQQPDGGFVLPRFAIQALRGEH